MKKLLLLLYSLTFVASVDGASPYPPSPINLLKATLAPTETLIDCTEQALLDAINATNSSGGGTIKFNCQNSTILMTQGLGSLQDNVTIDGESQNITLEYTTDFAGCATGDNGIGAPPIAKIEGQNNVIRGLTFKNFLESIQLKGPNNTIEDNTFLGHTCSDDALSSVTFEAVNNTVRNNHLQDYEDKAFQISFGGGSIVNNTFLDTRQTVRGPYDNSLGATFYITDNQMLTTGDTSKCAGLTIDGTYSIRFVGNTLKCKRGLRIGGGTQIIIDGNVIESNDRVGIRIRGSAVASISNNSVTNNGFGGGSLPAGGIVVWENAQADLGGGSLVIDGQTVSSSGNNIIQGNGVADVRNLRASYTLKAENNCWDHQNLVDVQNLDVEGNVDVDPLSCTPDTTPPTVLVTSPASNTTISAISTISASASDNRGVQSVQFKVDGTTIATDTTSSYSTSWDTGTVANGSHSLTAVATDTSGNTATSAAVTVDVDNGTPPPPVLDDSVAHWTFDDGSGTVTVDAAGNSNGTVFGAVWVAGVAGSALDFNGTTSHVVIDNTLDITGTQITLAAWIQPRDGGTANGSRVISKRTDAGGSDVWAMATSQNRVHFRLDGEDMSSSHVFAPNEWLHVAMIYNGVDKLIYVNGVLDASTPQAKSDPIDTSARPVHLGMREGEGRHFNGLIDEVRIYNRALTSTEVSALFNGTTQKPAPPTGLRTPFTQ